MKPDPFRARLRELLQHNDLTMKRASHAIGRNHSFLQQYLTREHPRVLRHRDCEALANILGCKPEELRHPVVPPRKPAKRQRRRPPAGAPVAEVPEIAGDPAACLLRNEKVPRESARWFLPDTMLRQEAGADPGDLRIVRMRGDSMQPVLSEGDRLVIDTAPANPTTGELCVLFDGSGVAVRRVEVVPGTEPAQLRLTCANPNYAPIACLAGEARIVGKVLWAFRRM